MGRGIGSSSGVARVGAGLIELVAPRHVEGNLYWGPPPAEARRQYVEAWQAVQKLKQAKTTGPALAAAQRKLAEAKTRRQLSRSWSTSQKSAWDGWLVWEILGVLFGGLFSAWIAGRLKFAVERGPNITPWPRLALALGGGILSGWATRLAAGCTSGQALTGGAALAVGSWAFMFAVFAGAYATAYFVRRQWS
ncbi:MAG: YeeE/YedE family protein [Proteobacteria bacterium]|nr:YeeE/YedE family protein [Pseudomonadota bacterium]